MFICQIDYPIQWHVLDLKMVQYAEVEFLFSFCCCSRCYTFHCFCTYSFMSSLFQTLFPTDTFNEECNLLCSWAFYLLNTLIKDSQLNLQKKKNTNKIERKFF